jgi:membrane associated rhomboid family serine protease
MFIATPLAPRARLSVAPVATGLLVLLNLAVAAWTLPQAADLRGARLHAEAVESPDGTPGVPPRLHAIRRAAVGAELAAVAARDPFEVWGFRRGDSNLRALPALFVHADASHVLVNIVALALAGACLEQVWGAAATLALFLGAGALALDIDAWVGPPGLLLGASAGAAGLLGACFVRFRNRRVPFGYMHLEYLRPRFGVFHVRAHVVGVAWVGLQAIGAALAAWRGETDIAFVSHLVGAGVGILVAWCAEHVTGHTLTAPPLQKQPS